MPTFTKADIFSMKTRQEYSEAWVESLIADDPGILGLGELEVVSRQRRQPRAGRLDLLLANSEQRRYEVEIQLGATDESHIIRTIEYWDIERKRYPQYDHCAVLVAEEVTSRFLNVISLFNGAMPLIAIQMKAMTVGGHVTLVFTKVMDELVRGEDLPVHTIVNRAYWDTRATKVSMAIVDELIHITRDIEGSLNPKYNKFYIGVERNGFAYNFVGLYPRKQHVLMEVKLPETEEVDAIIKQAGFGTRPYDARWSSYRLEITDDDFKHRRDALRDLMKRAYDYRGE